ncbi:hypothetical protein [Streptomyces sp. NPDC097981]
MLELQAGERARVVGMRRGQAARPAPLRLCTPQAAAAPGRLK